MSQNFSVPKFDFLLILVFITIFILIFFSDKLPLQRQQFEILIVEEPPKRETDSQLVNKGTKFIQNVPHAPFILGNSNISPRFENRSCAKFPTVYQLQFTATIWQVQKQKDWTFYLFGAYWDDRVSSVRVLTLVDRLHEHINKTYCQIWFSKSSRPMIIEVTTYTYIWFRHKANVVNGELQPYFLNCDLPKNYSGLVPTSVSIVSTICESATNNLKIHYDKPLKKEKIAVCAKGLSFFRKDWSVRLVEWIELLKIMGVSKIVLYDLQNHPNVNKVLKYYTESNYTEVLPLTHPSGIPNEPHLRDLYLKADITTQTRARKRQQEMIPINDCVYRNMHKYEYIAVLDTDEIIIPHNGANDWIELLEDLESTYSKKPPAPQFYTFLDGIFSRSEEVELKTDETIPKYFYTLKHTIRKQYPEGKNIGTKCLFRPQDILISRHHHQICVQKCTNVYVNTTMGFLHHYTADARIHGTVSYVTDRTIWKWKDTLIRNSNAVLKSLEFLS